ncbi:MAG: RecB family exonuclease, partial [Nocardioidaceae bacterium]
ETVTLNGRVDRVETDANGRVFVVDFKTSKNAPSQKSLAENPQLGLYQLAVEQGGLAEVCGEGAEPGGAELVQLRVDAGGMPKVQTQPPQTPDEQGRRPIEIQLGGVSATVRSETFDATVNDYCKFCDFAQMCPTQQRSGGLL